MLRRTGRLEAYRVYLGFSGAFSLFFSMLATTNLVYQSEVVGLNPLQLVLVGTALESAVFLFEVPTGVVADVYSRRLSVIIGVALVGCGFLVEGSVATFAAVLAAQLVWGFGYTFISGAGEAWIVDELGGGRITRVFLRGSQVRMAGALVGALASVALASIELRLPILVAGGCMLALAATLALVMPERGFAPKPRDERTGWASLTATFIAGSRVVRGNRLLRTVMLITLFGGLASEGVDRLSPKHFIDDIGLPALGSLKPVVWFGVIRVGELLLGILATELTRRRVDTSDRQLVTRLLGWLTLGQVGATVIFAATGSFPLALLSYLGIGLVRRVTGPTLAGFLNAQIDSGVRATVLSMHGQVDALGQISGGPGIGLIGTAASIRAALTASAALLAPAAALYGWLARSRADAAVVADG